ncbi:hypothetical protein KL951_004148 [Ogataea haglerorum]|nr:hypothetical protein KL951_004148 [Ogataea haglerorum]
MSDIATGIEALSKNNRLRQIPALLADRQPHNTMFGARKGHDWIHTTILVDEVDIRLGDFLVWSRSSYLTITPTQQIYRCLH